MMRILRASGVAAGLAAIFALAIHTPASAQQAGGCGYWSGGTWIATCGGPSQAYQSSPCGYWAQGAWIGTACQPQRRRVAVNGTIIGVDNNLLTVQVGPARTVIVNDEPALNDMDTGHIYTGRVITAYGHWNGQEFIATSIA